MRRNKKGVDPLKLWKGEIETDEFTIPISISPYEYEMSPNTQGEEKIPGSAPEPEPS